MQENLILPANVVATDVSLEDYMEHYAEQHCEWIQGVVISVAPAELKHNDIIYYLFQLLRAYFELRPIGRVVGQPFVMRLPEFPDRRREPDLLVVLNTNPHDLTTTFMDGPADIVIEVVSESSAERDHGEKFIEYEKGNVPEYWILDPLRQESRFYRHDESGRYRRQEVDVDGFYTAPALPGLKNHVPVLWEDSLPGPVAIARQLKTWLPDEQA